MVASALASLAAATCLATPVHGERVHAGPFVGYLTPGYDVVGGRFRLHVGQYRIPGSLSQKIPWFVPHRYRVGDTLVVTGRRLGPSPGAFMQTFRGALSLSTPVRHVFPSIIAPPSAGCWRLTFRSGRLVGSLTALVSNSP